jgi:DNA-binding LytR/AlgR family response regulator
MHRLEDVQLVGCADGCASGARMIETCRPDLILLDIRMRDGTAFDLLAALEPPNVPMICFVTAYPRYAFRAFETEAIGYLLKPVELEKLRAVVEKARRHLQLTTAEERAADLQGIVEQLREADERGVEASKYHHEIWVRHRGTDRIRIAVSEIDWIGVQEDYACIHAHGREHLVRMSLDRLMQNLDPAEFVRIHRSAVVRADRVEQVRLRRTGVREAVLRDGTRVPIGRIYARTLPWQ